MTHFVDDPLSLSPYATGCSPESLPTSPTLLMPPSQGAWYCYPHSRQELHTQLYDGDRFKGQCQTPWHPAKSLAKSTGAVMISSSHLFTSPFLFVLLIQEAKELRTQLKLDYLPHSMNKSAFSELKTIFTATTQKLGCPLCVIVPRNGTNNLSIIQVVDFFFFSSRASWR